jgi:hypothetical protein
VLGKLAAQEECLPALGAALSQLFVAAEGSVALAGVPAAILSVVEKLSKADSTQRSANQTVLLDHSASLARFLASPDAAVRGPALEIVASVVSTHAEIAGGVLREAKVLPALAAVLRETGPAASQALRALAMAAHASPECAAELADLGVVECTIDLLGKGDPEAATAFWSLTGSPALAQRFAAYPATLPTISALFSRADSKLSVPVCAAVANMCTQPGFAVAVQSAGILQVLSAMLGSGVQDLQAQALRTLAAVSTADPRVADSVGATPGIIVGIVAALRAPIPLLVFNAAALVVAMVPSAVFRGEFVRNNGLPSLISTATTGDEHVRERSIAALTAFAAVGEQDRAAIRSAKGIQAFVEVLFSGSA